MFLICSNVINNYYKKDLAPYGIRTHEPGGILLKSIAFDHFANSARYNIKININDWCRSIAPFTYYTCNLVFKSVFNTLF